MERNSVPVISVKGPSIVKECPICLEEITKKTKSICKNNHHFHPKCINQWLEKESTCPICRDIIDDTEPKPCYYLVCLIFECLFVVSLI